MSAEFQFPLEKELKFRIPKALISYEQLKTICYYCSQGVPVEAAFRMTGLSTVFKIMRNEAKYFPNDDCAKILDFCFSFYYASQAQVFIHMNKLATSAKNTTAILAARLLLEYERFMNKLEEERQKLLN